MTGPVISPEVQEKLGIVDFGLEVQQFLGSKIGRFLTERAQGEVEEMTQRLKTFDVMADPVGAKNLQMEIKCAENVLYWLADAINAGTQLMEQMIAEDRQASGSGEGSQSGDATGST